jgi:predicted phage-related endonuclease
MGRVTARPPGSSRRKSSGDAETIAIDGVPAYTYKAQTTDRIDTAALRAAHPEIAARFVKTSSYRVFRALNGKEK